MLIPCSLFLSLRVSPTFTFLSNSKCFLPFNNEKKCAAMSFKTRRRTRRRRKREKKRKRRRRRDEKELDGEKWEWRGEGK